MKVSEILEEVRIQEKDEDEVVYSDYDLLNALNKANRILVNYFSLKDADFLTKEVEYLAEDVREGVTLPSDYVTLKQVLYRHRDRLGNRHGAFRSSPYPTPHRKTWYKIEGNTLYAHGDIILVYKGGAMKVEEDDDLIYPYSFFDLVCMVTRLVLANTARDVMTERIEEYAKELIPLKKYANVKIGMDFRV